jgi:hypothetical protein
MFFSETFSKRQVSGKLHLLAVAVLSRHENTRAYCGVLLRQSAGNAPLAGSFTVAE